MPRDEATCLFRVARRLDRIEPAGRGIACVVIGEDRRVAHAGHGVRADCMNPQNSPRLTTHVSPTFAIEPDRSLYCLLVPKYTS